MDIDPTYIYIEETDSTNSYLSRMLAEQPDTPAYTVIRAAYQYAGRGQRGHHWEAQRGKNLLFSILLRPQNIKAANGFAIQQIVSLSIHKVLSQYADVECGPDFDAIVRLVCESFGLTQKQLASPSRRQELVLARNTIYYLARKHTEMSLAEIGSRFNRRHTTVIKGISSVERELCKETRVGRQIARAVSLIERNAGVVCASA